MKIFDILNKSNSYLRFIAKDGDEAVEMAIDYNHVRNKENATIKEMTEELIKRATEKEKEEITEILGNKKRGILAWRGVSYSIDEIMSPNFEQLRREKIKQAGYHFVEYKKVKK